MVNFRKRGELLLMALLISLVLYRHFSTTQQQQQQTNEETSENVISTFLPKPKPKLKNRVRTTKAPSKPLSYSLSPTCPRLVQASLLDCTTQHSLFSEIFVCVQQSLRFPTTQVEAAPRVDGNTYKVFTAINLNSVNGIQEGSCFSLFTFVIRDASLRLHGPDSNDATKDKNVFGQYAAIAAKYPPDALLSILSLGTVLMLNGAGVQELHYQFRNVTRSTFNRVLIAVAGNPFDDRCDCGYTRSNLFPSLKGGLMGPAGLIVVLMNYLSDVYAAAMVAGYGQTGIALTPEAFLSCWYPYDTELKDHLLMDVYGVVFLSMKGTLNIGSPLNHNVWKAIPEESYFHQLARESKRSEFHAEYREHWKLWFQERVNYEFGTKPFFFDFNDVSTYAQWAFDSRVWWGTSIDIMEAKEMTIRGEPIDGVFLPNTTLGELCCYRMNTYHRTLCELPPPPKPPVKLIIPPVPKKEADRIRKMSWDF